MTVYLGTYGQVELRRMSDDADKASVVNAGDVNVSRRRFSFDFDTGFLTTGDQLQISRTDAGTLEFVSAAGFLTGVKQSSGTWYINVDELGGIRLFDTFDKALEGLQSQAIALEAIVSDVPISVKIANSIPHILTQCTYFELNTNREVVDTTALGDEFRSQFSGLISGSGNFRAYWDYLPSYARSAAGEYANYLLQLAIRTEVGAKFAAKLYLRVGDDSGSKTTIDDEIWYDIEGVITQAGVNFAADNVVEISADFVTTGPIRLLAKTTPSNKVLQEDTGEIRLEQDSTQSLLQEDFE
jgi:hypothetical protein